MFLRSLIVRNYRSLENVRLEDLDRFNVLIGRNNSGKSSIFGALQLLTNRVRQGDINMSRVLTDLDPSRSLEITLMFELSTQERRDYLDLLRVSDNRKEAMLSSPLFQYIEFHFEAPAGQPELLNLQETRVRTEDAKWATTQRRIGDLTSENEQSTMVLIEAIRDHQGDFTLNETVLDVATTSQINGLTTAGVELRSEMYNYAQSGAQYPSFPLTMWLQRRLVEYLGDAFFFDPFRHSEESWATEGMSQLAQDGSNLAQVLFTLRNNDNQTFHRIEEFVQAALPDIGTLETRVEGSTTWVSFARPDGSYEVLLRDMGSGIEQLLMTATVLMTTREKRTLFLEEPESHLHAGAQRFLIERLYEGDRQVFVTTHSPTFVNLSRSRGLYQVTFSEERTRVARLGDADSLGAMLDDIGARNSDVLLSDAVLFVEGRSDGDVLHAWSETLGMSLEESNVTVLHMEGGDYAQGKARVRSEILEGISEKAPVPHLLVLDRDERSPAELEKLQRGLGDKVYLFEKREIENYLLVPRALLAALRLKHRNDPPLLKNIELASTEDVQGLIETTAESLYGIVLTKRIRATLEGLKGGLLPRSVAESVAPLAHRKDLARILRGRIRSRVNDHIGGLDIDGAVHSEREALDREWSNAERHLQLAPGEEILEAVFSYFGSSYKKPRDTVRIAEHMRTDEIAPEAKDLITKAISLGSSQRN